MLYIRSATSSENARVLRDAYCLQEFDFIQENMTKQGTPGFQNFKIYIFAKNVKIRRKRHIINFKILPPNQQSLIFMHSLSIFCTNQAFFTKDGIC